MAEARLREWVGLVLRGTGGAGRFDLPAYLTCTDLYQLTRLAIFRGGSGRRCATLADFGSPVMTLIFFLLRISRIVFCVLVRRK